MRKIIAIALAVTLLASFIIIQARPTGQAVSGIPEGRSLAEVGDADVVDGFMTEMEIFSDLGTGEKTI